MASELTVIPLADIERMAKAVSASGLFGMKSPEQAFALMLIAQAEGKHPATAAQEYHIIQNRPALKADAMLARFQAAGGKVDWKEYTDQKVCGIFSHPQGGSVEITWTLEQAKRIGLATKDNWKSYPRAMLRARVISEGIRTVYPGVAIGVYTPEEVQDFDNKPGKVEKDMGRILPVEAAQLDAEPMPKEIEDHLRELAATIVQIVEVDGNPSGAYQLLTEENLDNEQRLFFWQLLGPNTRTRAALKKEGAVRAKDSRGEQPSAVEDLHSREAAA